MFEISEIVEQLLPTFDDVKNEDDIEVELRLGKYNGSFFDTNVGKDIFDKVLTALQKYEGWEKKEHTTSDVFYNDKNSIRITSDQDTGEQKMIQKIPIIKEDFVGSNLDMRFAISREVETFGEYDMDRKRTKQRHSFIRKNLSIDMTISTGDTVDPDDENPASYQIEFEIVKPGSVKNRDQFYNIVHKVNDLIKIISHAQK